VKSAACPTSETSLHAILSTHTLMPYPPVSSRINEQGLTVLAVAIGNDGAPTNVIVKQTSGSDRLDAAATCYIKAHWRWQPPTQGCSPTTAAVKVAWHIVKEPIPESGLNIQAGVETMTIYTRRIAQVSMR
jgi:TonB family protein